MTISPINLGNSFLNSSGQSVLSGLSSGIDSKSIIDQVVAAQTSQVTKLQDQITVNNKQSTALTTLNQLLTSFKTSASILSNPSSPDTTSNIFAVRTIDITSNTTQAASNFISAGVSSLATSGSYKISDISQLATAKIQTTQAFTLASADSVAVAATSTANQFTAGTITIKGKDITLTAGQTLNQVASAFNDVSATTGIQATVLQTDSGTMTIPWYRVKFVGIYKGEKFEEEEVKVETE
ncbi:MAG: flagellar cap protein FliD N-terminal domain-containing protein [Pseudomonadota bacterium]